MKGLRSAIGFLTILPLAPRNAAEDFVAARTWFPLVGLLLGSVLAGIDLMLHAAFQLLSTDSAPLHREFPPLVAGNHTKERKKKKTLSKRVMLLKT
jgi:hypothetical protein